MERTNKKYLIFSWCSCLYYIILLLLLATTIPTSHQIRNNHEFEKGVLHNERGVLDRRLCGGLGPTSPIPVKLLIQDDYVIIDNSIVQITISKPGGIVVGIRYNDLENLLEVQNRRENRGYWDLNWSGGYDKITGTDGWVELIVTTSLKSNLDGTESVQLKFSAGYDTASWVAGAFNKVAKAAGDMGQKAKEKDGMAEDEHRREMVDDYARVCSGRFLGGGGSSS